MQEENEFVLALIIDLLWPSAGACQNTEKSNNSVALQAAKIQIFLISKRGMVLNFFWKLFSFLGPCTPLMAHQFN